MPASASRRRGRSRPGWRRQPHAGYQAIGLFESDYSAMIAAGVRRRRTAGDPRPTRCCRRRDRVLLRLGPRRRARSRSSAIRENLIHMAEVFRPHHVSLGEVRGPAGAASSRRRRRPIRGGLRPGRSLRCRRAARVPPLVGHPGHRHERRGRRASRSRQRRHLPRRLALLPRPVAPRSARRRRPGTGTGDRSERRAAPPFGDPVEDTTRRPSAPRSRRVRSRRSADRHCGRSGSKPSMGVEILSEQQAAMHPAEAARASFDAARRVLAHAGYA